VHNYHGTCISGAKRFAFPVMRPCTRRFGIPCLLCYFPRRCGGLSPITMWQQFLLQRRRLRAVRRCAAVVTHSFHMYSEYAKHGVALDRLHRFVYFSPEPRKVALPVFAEGQEPAQTKPNPWQRPASEPLRITFAGRIDLNKGVHLLIDAAPQVARRLNRNLLITIAGDGPMRAHFQQQAKQVEGTCDLCHFEFTGWLGREQVAWQLAAADVVVFPSAWPEPFGLVGPEAGHLGIPVAAFNVGGVRGWLVDGVNGYLAPGDPPSAEGLAAAIANCLRDERTYQRLCRGAIEMAARFSRGNHLQELLAVFERVLAEHRTSVNAKVLASNTFAGSAVAVDQR
jgi:glycosyltransferase involved in cell wall biosynthesis